ncbi:MAG TPA: hypothetical protein VGO38_10925 [Acidimicrobiia bacterium]
MAQPVPAIPRVRAEVANEEARAPELAPLADVHELVGDQVTVVLVTATHQDPAAEGHPRDPGREQRHDDEAGALEIVSGDVGEQLALARIEPPPHRFATA